jgi:pilus assembly protein Flp/PilA
MLLQHYVKAKLWLSEDRGASAVEYGLLVGLIAIVIIAAVTLLGNRVSTTFSTAATSLP